MDKKKLPKSARMLKLAEIFERGQVLDKKEIDSRMMSVLGEERSALSLALYRDLQDLVAQGLLAQKFFRSDGSEITSEDLESEKYYVSKWLLSGVDHVIVGKGLITQVGGNLFVSQRLQKDIAIRDTAPITAKDLNIVFDLTRALRLSIDRECLPINILVCRSTSELNSNLFSELETKFGKRLVLLALTDQTLSSAKNTSKPGHLHLEISPTAVTARDLGTRNPSQIASRDVTDFWTNYSKSFNVSDLQETLDQKRISMGDMDFQPISNAGNSRSLPAAIRLADSKYLVIGS